MKYPRYQNNYVILKTDSIGNMHGQLIVSFLPNNQASFIFYSDEPKLLNVVRVNNLIYLESKDTTSLNYQFYQHYGNNSFLYNAIAYSPLYSETFPISAAFGGNLTRTKLCNYLEIANDEIRYPLISFTYIHHITKYDGYGESYKNYNNRFNENCIQKLGELDTLAVQQLKVILTKNK